MNDEELMKHLNQLFEVFWIDMSWRNNIVFALIFDVLSLWKKFLVIISWFRLIIVFRSGTPLWLSFSVRPSVLGRTMHIGQKPLKITWPNFVCKLRGQYGVVLVACSLTSEIKLTSKAKIYVFYRFKRIIMKQPFV